MFGGGGGCPLTAAARAARAIPPAINAPPTAISFVFAVVGVAGFATGLSLLGLIATAFALVAAFLNAAFGICLGCQLYPLVARLRRAPTTA